MKPEIKKFLESMGHYISSEANLPKRDGYHYESFKTSDKKVLAVALHSNISRRPFEHWYSTNDKLYVMVKDDKIENERNYKDLIISESERYKGMLKEIVNEEPFILRHPREDEESSSLVLEEEKRRVKIREKRHQEEIKKILTLWPKNKSY